MTRRISFLTRLYTNDADMRECDMDWTDCPEIEQVPGRLSGLPVLKGSRVPPSDLLLNLDEGPEWLAEAHQLPLGQVKTVLAFYRQNQKQLAPAV
jgi:uncharacterized protein (DUF433 family)